MSSAITTFVSKAPTFMALLMQDFGFDELDAAAIMGNAGHESGGLTIFQEIKPTVAGSRGGFGWFQWTGPRRVAFESYCSRNGLDPKSDKANYGFLFVELKGPESAAIDKTKAAKGLEAKVKAFEMSFERAGHKAYDSRLKWAERALDAFQASGNEGRPLPEPIPEAPPPKLGEVMDALMTEHGLDEIALFKRRNA
jgi:hypothetical protein